MKRFLLYILFLALPALMYGQNIQQHQLEDGVRSGMGSGEVFSPFRDTHKDSTKNEINVPKEIHQWRVNEQTGEVMAIDADTMQYWFQNRHLTEGPNSEYNFLGNMGTPRMSRIFFNRPTTTSYDFLQPYDYFFTRPGEFIFTDTKSPYTNLSYHSSGNKIDGDDRFRAYFTKNAGKHFGIGFLFDYLYARGRYDNQASSQMNFSLFSFYRSDRYNYNLLASRYHMKQAENGGITDDRYITRPEETDGSNSNFGTSDIPVKLDDTWNRNEVYTLFFTHNYNMGFYREKALLDSTATDSIVNEFVRVARITHTADITQNSREFINYRLPAGYYADTFLPKDSTDKTRYFEMTNRISLSLCEGFSKWAFADVTAFAQYRYNHYSLPDTMATGGMEYRRKYNEHILSVGGSISSNRWKHFRYHVEGETAVNGEEIGAFSLDGKLEFDFKLWKREIILKAHAFMKNNRPSFYYRHYHGEHIWWDNDNLDKEFKTRIEGELHIPSWRTRLSVGAENVKNYTYIANNAVETTPGRYLNRFAVAQESGNIQIFTAALKQDFTVGIFNLNTEITYQKSSNRTVIPLPELNVYANMFLRFRIARVLNTEIGADAIYFTEYYAPDYSPALGQFVQQNQADKVAIGNYPIASVYANFLLKQTRFYVKYYHVNEGTGNRRHFLVPHYPTTKGVLWLGLSWNFYN
ncbi:MAG: putative porin [Bacteroidaceae bacterium]|nr:putative porin [Bacteroidaceae bacterium]